jgi:hypothetical protein
MKTLSLTAVLLLAACADMGKASIEVRNVTPKAGPDELGIPGEDPNVVEQPPVPIKCDVGTSYSGFGGMLLEVGRGDEDQGFDRDRVKPFSALSGEYARVLGTTPALLTTMGATFGATPARWFVEPEQNAVALYSAVRVAFVGCLGATASGAEFASVPTPSTATEQCQKFARKFWSRSASQEELDACVTVATTGSAPDPEPRRKWAYTCAAVLSSAPFLTF